MNPIVQGYMMKIWDGESSGSLKGLDTPWKNTHKFLSIFKFWATSFLATVLVLWTNKKYPKELCSLQNADYTSSAFNNSKKAWNLLERNPKGASRYAANRHLYFVDFYENGCTRQKLCLVALQRDKILRQQYATDISIYDHDMFIFLDETGANQKDLVRHQFWPC